MEPHGYKSDYPEEERQLLHLSFGKTGPRLSIAGDTEDEMAQTAAYFMQLENTERKGKEPFTLAITWITLIFVRLALIVFDISFN